MSATLVAQAADELCLVRQVRRARIVNAMVLIVGVPLFHTLSGWMETMLVFGAIGVSIYIPTLVARRSAERLQRAFDQGQAAAARRELAGLRTLYAGIRGAREGLRLVEAGILLLEERYEESERLLDAINPARLRRRERVGLDLYQSWCRVERGDAEAAVALAQS